MGEPNSDEDTDTLVLFECYNPSKGEIFLLARGDYYLPSRLLEKRKGEMAVFTLYVMSHG